MSGGDSDDGGRKPDDASLVIDIGYAMRLAKAELDAKDRRMKLAERRRGMHLVPAPKTRKRKPPAKP
jgi:hypothetical protein